MRLFILTVCLSLVICCFPLLSARGDSGGKSAPPLPIGSAPGYPSEFNPYQNYPFSYNGYGFNPYSFNPYYNPYFPYPGANPYAYGPNFVPPVQPAFAPVSPNGDMSPAPEAQPAQPAREGPGPNAGYSDWKMSFPKEAPRFPQ